MWKLIDISEAEIAAWAKEFGEKARFLIDEDLDPALAPLLADRGYNSKAVLDVGLAGHSDEDVLAFAKREDRILVTNDDGFADERRFPEHRNPGVVIVPSGRLDDPGVIEAIASMLPLVGHYRPMFTGAVVKVDRHGVLSITDREHESGARRTSRYRYTKSGSFYWDPNGEGAG
jgi:predicted nuclease of predicted toxin-antitoxin system